MGYWLGVQNKHVLAACYCWWSLCPSSSPHHTSSPSLKTANPMKTAEALPNAPEWTQLQRERWTCKATGWQTQCPAPWPHTPPCECSLSQARRVQLLQPPAPTWPSTQMQNMSMNMNAAHQHHYEQPSLISQHLTIEFTLTRRCQLTPALPLRGFLVGFGGILAHGLHTPGFLENPYPSPSKPVPLGMGTGLLGYGCG